MSRSNGVAERVRRAMALWPAAGVAIWAVSAAFLTYSCMYAFRKPFLAATFQNEAGWPFPIDFKSALIISQVLGYTLSKIMGVKVVSEAGEAGRGRLVFALIMASEAALLLFAIVPVWLKPAAMFLNGLPLGMIWGLVIRYLEGRRTSEILAAGLCTSFILASGVVKWAGASIMQFGVTELWMPAATGLAFLPLTGFAILALSLTPVPSAADRIERVARTPMTLSDRRAFFNSHRVGLVLLGAAFVALGTLRDFRDNFSAELWQDLGFGHVPALFALSETPAALLVLGAVAIVSFERRNREATRLIHAIMLLGVLLGLSATILFQMRLLGPIAWMTMLGAGIYLGYVPCTSILADRLIATLRSGGNAGYLANLFDAWAYFGSLSLLIYRALETHEAAWLSFFLNLTYVCIAISAVALLGAMAYFDHHSARAEAADMKLGVTG